MVRGALRDDHMIQLKVVTGTLNSQKYQDQIQESGVRLPLDSLDDQNMILRDDIARPHYTRIIEEYKKQQNITSPPGPSLLLELNPIKHVWDEHGDVVETKNQPYQNHCEYCKTLLQEWDRISCLDASI